MKTRYIIIFILSSIYVQAQSIDSLLHVGEQFYHQKAYWKARNAFYHAYKQDNTNAQALSNLLLVYHKTKEHHTAYEKGLAYFSGVSSIPERHQAHIYHNFALNCEAMNYTAEALHYYKKANKLKNHSIRVDKIKYLQAMVNSLDTILPKIEKKLPPITTNTERLEQRIIPSYHPISAALHHFILKKIEHHHDSFEGSSSLDSTTHFSPLRIRFLDKFNIYVLTCHVQFDWWKNNYTFNLYVGEQGQIIDIPIQNQFIKNVLIENNDNYIIHTDYSPSGHGHWQISTLYHYNRTNKEVKPLLNFIKSYFISSLHCPDFHAHIYIQNNHYRIKYGHSKTGTDEIDTSLGDEWLYKNGRINAIVVPTVYATSFQALQKRYSTQMFRLLDYVKFE